MVEGKQTILVLAANSVDQAQLRLDEEFREIYLALRSSLAREEFQLERRGALRAQDFQQAMLDLEPTIVHFCGHGSREGLVLEDVVGGRHIVTPDAVSNLFKLFASHLECVLLNACYSSQQAEAISQHVPYVIGMDRAIGDLAAISYSRAFYSALGSGRTIEFAHQIACNAIHLYAPGEQSTPVLLENRGAQAPLANDLDTVSYLRLKQLDRAGIQEILRQNRERIRRQPSNALARLNAGLIYLHLKDYNKAIPLIGEAMTLAPENADAYYYYSVAIARGRRPKHLKQEEVECIERNIAQAIKLDDRPAEYYYYLGIVKYDYYYANSLPSREPNYSHFFRLARSKMRNEWEIERLLDSVTLAEEGLIRLIKRSEGE